MKCALSLACLLLLGQSNFVRADQGNPKIKVIEAIAFGPNGLLLITLLSNFGTFVLYGLTNIICIVAFREHHEFNGFKHVVVPIFGALANFACLAFYIIGPIEGLGSAKEPLRRAASPMRPARNSPSISARPDASETHRLLRS